MSRTLRFWKYHGTGNDFVLTYASEGDLSSEDVARICDRHTGVGADGVIRVHHGGERLDGFPDAADADLIMDYRNADGSVAEMCGNGIRCLVAFAFDRGLTSAEDLTVATRDGMKRVRVLEAGGRRQFRVEMGPARFARGEIPMSGDAKTVFHDGEVDVDGEIVVGTAVSIGNPHLVVFVEQDLMTVPLEVLGPRLASHPMFPEGANVEFVNPVTDTDLDARVWERGIGETQACGTGACAVAAAALATGRGAALAVVRFPGGDLAVEVTTDHVVLIGPAVEVFDGSIAL